MGADGVTCVCKQGYSKVNGVCTKKGEEKVTVKLHASFVYGDQTVTKDFRVIVMPEEGTDVGFRTMQ